MTEMVGDTVREEAGVEGEVIGPLGYQEYTVDGRRVRTLDFLVRHVRDVPAEEARRLVWCDLRTMLQRITFADTRAIIAAAIATWRESAGEGSG